MGNEMVVGHEKIRWKVGENREVQESPDGTRATGRSVMNGICR